jgi:hypothetical protein
VTSKRASQRYAVGARHASPESIHCAELLRDELNELGISLIRLARDTRILLSCVSLIVNGRRSITAIRPCAWRTSSRHPLNCG